MRQEIENQAMDPLSLSAEDLEKDAMLDYSKIFSYVQGPMLNSRLYSLFNIRPHDQRPVLDLEDDESSIYSNYKKELKENENSGRLEHRLPGLDSLIARLENQCKRVFDSIAETQQRKVRFGDLIELSSQGARHHDVRMIIQVL